MSTFLAAAPLLLATLAILLARQSALRAGGGGLLAAILIAALSPDFALSFSAILIAVTDGLLTTVTVAYVLLGGVMLYQVLKSGRALERLGQAIAGAVPDPAQRVLVLVLGVSVFLESATGFGVGIIVTVPLLLALGYGPWQSALIALLGQCAVPWGALAIGTVLGAELSGLPAAPTAIKAVWLGLPFILLCAFAALRIAAERLLRPRHILAALGYSLLLAMLLHAGSMWISVELAGCLAGLGVTFTGLALGRPGAPARTAAQAGRARGLLMAALPFAVLMLALTLTRLSPTISGITASLLRIEWPAFDFTLAPVHHPGFWMLLAAISGIFCLRIPGPEVRLLLPRALRQWWLASLSVAGFICFGHVMLHAGMTERLAESVAHATGTAYLFAAPVIGGLGGFLTASNAGSNAIFMAFQSSVAARLGLDPVLVAAAQNAAGANITLASPGRIVLAASVSGLAGEEARLMRPALALGLAGIILMLPVLALL